MTPKIISYDLCEPGRNYDGLYEAIKSYYVWAAITESTWIVRTSSSSAEIWDRLNREVDANDRLFVAELSSEAKWKKTISSNEKVRKVLEG